MHLPKSVRSFLWWLIKKLIFLVDCDNTLLTYSFVRDKTTDYHVIAERFYPDRHVYGVKEEYYEKEHKIDG